LEVDYCGSALVYVATTSTIVVTNSITMDVAQQWALLTKKKNFEYPKVALSQFGHSLHLLPHLFPR
jgi:hypothetical protein